MSEKTLAKIAISSSADAALSKILEQVNANFEGGRVTKVDLASWLITRSTESLDDSTIDEIQKAHFNQVAYLDALVKKMRASGRDSLGADDIVTLQAMLGHPSSKKRERVTKPGE